MEIIKKSIIRDSFKAAGDAIKNFDIDVNETELAGKRTQLVKATAGVVLLAAARSPQIQMMAATGLLISGADYLNHRFDVTNRVVKTAKKLNRIAVESVKIMKGVNENA